MLLHILLYRRDCSFIVPVLFRVNIPVGIIPVRAWLQSDWLIGDNRSPMIYHDPVADLYGVALLVIIVPDLIHIQALRDCIPIHSQTGEDHRMTQNCYILKLLCHSVYSHLASPRSGCLVGKSQPYTLPISSPRRLVILVTSALVAVPSYSFSFSRSF